MISIKATANIDTSKLDQIANNKAVGLFGAKAMEKGMAQFVPRLEGILYKETEVTPFHVKYHAPHARKRFFEGNVTFTTTFHQNATARWDKAFKAAGADQLAAEITDYLKGL